MKTQVLFGLIFTFFFEVNAQRFTKQLTEEKDFEFKPDVTVVIDNIYGNVQVRSSENPTIHFTINKRLKGYTSSQLEKAIADVKISWIERNDSLIAYIQAPFICNHWDGCRKQGRWIRNYEKYEFNFDIEITMPSSANLTVSTIDQGQVTVDGIKGLLVAKNVNGDVFVKGANKLLEASTVDGDVVVEYASVPTVNAIFKTISGDLKLHCDSNLNAIVYSKSMDGDFFTSFDYKSIPTQMIRSTTTAHAKTKFKIENKTGIQIGNEIGPQLSLETLSGNMYLNSL